MIVNFLDQLHRKLRDAQFQSDRLLKIQPMDQNYLVQFAQLSHEIKEDLLSLKTDSVLKELIDELAVLNPSFSPPISGFRKLIGLITFGWSTRKYIAKTQYIYIESTIRELKKHYAYLENHLSDV
jgi:hypothetical protein